MKVSNLLIILVILISSVSFTYAHEEDNKLEETHEDEPTKSIFEDSLFYLLIATVISILFVLYAVHIRRNPKIFNKQKTILFLAITLPLILATIYLVFSTIHLNIISDTKGPVHWHADFEIYMCGDEIDIINPKGLSNRVGTSVFHEHGDDRIHVEGVVVNPKDVSLKNYFMVIGGSLTDDGISIPTDQGSIKFHNEDLCDNNIGNLQVFVYKTENKIIHQEKLENFEEYVLSPYANVPPGDCIIIEFDEEKESTDKICETYKIALEKGDLIGHCVKA